MLTRARHAPDAVALTLGPASLTYVGLRSKVVHGDQWEVPADSVKNVEALARVLLSSRLLGDVSDSLRAELLTAADLPS